jgi:hypothetical protein
MNKCPVPSLPQMFERIEALLDALAARLEELGGQDEAHSVRVQRYELNRLHQDIEGVAS